MWLGKVAAEMRWNRVAVEGVVRDLATERFGQAMEFEVDVQPDFDSDGEPILRITIVVESTSALSTSGLTSFVRHLRSQLAAQDVEDFPVITYVSKAEAGKRAVAAH